MALKRFSFMWVKSNPGVMRAAKELKAFKKVLVTAGDEVAVTMEIAGQRSGLV